MHGELLELKGVKMDGEVENSCLKKTINEKDEEVRKLMSKIELLTLKIKDRNIRRSSRPNIPRPPNIRGYSLPQNSLTSSRVLMSDFQRTVKASEIKSYVYINQCFPRAHLKDKDSSKLEEAKKETSSSNKNTMM
jgi:hypothetical protein